jgi:outer membrane protein assembly factor BamB
MRPGVPGWLGGGLAAILGLSMVEACHPSKATGGSTGTGGATSSSTSSSSGTVMAGDSVLTHHKNPNRDGLYVQPTFTKAAIGTLHRDASFSATLPLVNGAAEPIYAQLLFVDGMGGQDLVIVVTENNNVYALDGATGAQVWAKNLGPPVPQSALPCGNIFPMGITGTPVIDLASRTLFVDAAVLVSGGSAPPPHHQIFALSIDTGATRSGWPVDVNTAATSSAATFNSAFQGQRGALALLGGTLYVPYGGLYGDCQPQASAGLYPGTEPYRGWVVGVSTSDPAQVSAWATTYAAGGIWSPAGVSSDGTSLFVTTGNTFPPSGTSPWGGGEGLLRLAPSPLAMSEFFAPANWYYLDAEDGDLGTAPIPFDLPGSTPSALVIVFGKDGNGYLLDRTSLGGVGHSLGANAAACTPNDTTGACASGHPSSAEIISAPALYTTATATYVVGKGQCGTGSGPGDLFTAKVQPGSPPTLVNGWCAVNGAGSPMVTTSDGHADAIVWDLGAENDDRLHAFDGDTGAAIPFTDSSVSLAGMRRYNTPIAAKGRIFVPVDGGVFAFKL